MTSGRALRRDRGAQAKDPALALGAVHRELALPEGRLHYVEAGTGMPLVLLHGGHGSWTHWAANIAPLARSFRVLAVDMPGFGASFDPEPAYDIERYAGTVSRMLDALSIGRAAVAGFSFGGAVAAEVTSMEPQRIACLAMVNPPGIGPGSPRATAIQQDLSRLAVTRGLREGAMASLRRLQLYNHELIDDDVVDAMIANVRATRFVSRAASRSADTARALRSVRQPVQLFIGREDVHRQHGLQELLALMPQVAPQAQIHLVERARHWLQFDRADLFNERLAQFVGAV
jgi:2-hydroxy-6-oxonona-2,4-dienedioate hydrolase